MTMKVLLFCDGFGIEHLKRSIAWGNAVGIVGAGNRKQYHPELKMAAKGEKIPFLIQPIQQSDQYSRFVDNIKQLSPDLIIANSYSMIIRPDVFCIPEYGAINVHASLLPLNRGCNPTQWAIIKREANTGVTLHHIDEGIDTGDIIAQRTIPISFDDTWVTVQERFSNEIHLLLQAELPQILSGTIICKPQDNGKSTTNKRRGQEDGKFDFSDRVIDIYNLIRALVNPLPGAFYIENKEMKVIEKYMSISQVTAMKYGESSPMTLKTANYSISPFTDGCSDLPESLIQKCQQIPDCSTIYFEGAKWPGELSSRNDLILFGIKQRNIDRWVGICCLSNIDHVLNSANLWIKLEADQESEIKETESQVADLISEFAFKDLNLEQICSHPGKIVKTFNTHNELLHKRKNFQ